MQPISRQYGGRRLSKSINSRFESREEVIHEGLPSDADFRSLHSFSNSATGTRALRIRRSSHSCGSLVNSRMNFNSSKVLSAASNARFDFTSSCAVEKNDFHCSKSSSVAITHRALSTSSSSNLRNSSRNSTQTSVASY